MIFAAAPDVEVSDLAPLSPVVRFLDDHIVVVDKPARMAAHPCGRHRAGTLVQMLAAFLGREVFPVNRLDRETSGLMICALARRPAARLSRDFRHRRVAKSYVAMIEGVLAADSGEWHAPIGRSQQAWPHWGVRADGSPACTRFQVIERLARTTYLTLEPITGRTNQLRIHASAAGHPIDGDSLHGGAEPGARLFLHATALVLRHPVTGAALSVVAPLPAELQARLEALRGT